MTEPQNLERPKNSAFILYMEKAAAAVLLLVVGLVIWIVLAGYWPGLRVHRLGSVENEALLAVVILCAALALVSSVALLQTRVR